MPAKAGRCKIACANFISRSHVGRHSKEGFALELYYAVWANLRIFSVIGRAAIVFAIVIPLFWFIARPILLFLLKFVLLLLNQAVKGIFFLGQFILRPLADGAASSYIRYCNVLADVTGGLSSQLMKWAGGIKVQRHLFRMMALYLAVLLFIWLPVPVSRIIPKQYLHYFSGVSDLYQRLEAPALKASESYVPLFLIPDKGTWACKAWVDEKEIWLSLSETGRSGANVREGPGREYSRVTTIYGEERILYLRERSGNWLHIRREDGTEGWIHVSLISGRIG